MLEPSTLYAQPLHRPLPFLVAYLPTFIFFRSHRHHDHLLHLRRLPLPSQVCTGQRAIVAPDHLAFPNCPKIQINLSQRQHEKSLTASPCFLELTLQKSNAYPHVCCRNVSATCQTAAKGLRVGTFQTT